MIEVSVKTDDKLERSMALFDKKVREGVKKAEKAALLAGKKELQKQIEVRYKDANTKGSIKAKIKDGELVTEGRLLSIGDTHFSATPSNYISQEGIKVRSREKVRITIKEGHTTTFKHAFVANPVSIKGGHAIIWERTGKREKRKVPNRKKKQWVDLISPIKTVAVPEMANTLSDDVVDAMYRRYDARLKKYVGLR